MKKSIVFCACLAMVFASTAIAQVDSVIWMDARPNNAASGINTITGTLGALNPYPNDNVNGGRKGGGQTLYLEPVHADSWHTMFPTAFPNTDGDGNRSTGSLWVYMDVNDDPSGTGDVISSLGLDTDITKLGTLARNAIASISFTMINDNTVFNSITPAGGNPWNNKIDGAVVAGSPPDWAGAKAVRVPVDPGPMYNAALGIQPRPSGLTDIPYRVARLNVVAGTRQCTFSPVHAANSTFEVRLKTNNLLTTRVYNGGGDADERISYGYDGAGAPELPTISGNDTVSVSALADGVIVIRMKGDYSGDGRVTSADNGAHVGAVGDPTDNQLQAHSGDFTGDGRVTSADNASYLSTATASLSCP